MALKNWIKTIAISLFGTTLYGQNPEGFDKMASNMAGKKVPVVHVTGLDTLKANLLDSRERKEYDVSHVPNATWVGYDDFDLSRVEHLDKNEPIVVYCSVGYRSGKIGEKLKKAGFKEVYNLYGGVFAYANSGNELVNSKNQATNQVHGYNKKWSEWLNPAVCEPTY